MTAAEEQKEIEALLSGFDAEIRNLCFGLREVSACDP